MTRKPNQTSPSEKAQIYLLDITFWFWRRRDKTYRNSWAVSVWDTPEDLERYSKHTLARLRKKYNIKPDKGPFITEVKVNKRLSKSQLSLDEHRNQ